MKQLRGEYRSAVLATPSAARGAVARSGQDEADIHGLVSDFDAGFLVGILVGEGHFGGDGRQPQVTLRMHADHAALFEWLVARFPDSRLYGPYHHSGRHYLQWMARGRFLRDVLMPILRARLRPEHSRRVWERYEDMCRRYGLAPLDVDGETPEPVPGGEADTA